MLNNNNKNPIERQTRSSCLGDVRRSFSVGDWVVYKPFENCRVSDVSGKGKIIEDFGDGMYRVTFGYTSIYGTRTGNFNWSNLWAV